MLVAPLVGAWIEICVSRFMSIAHAVAPLVGAWIEISLLSPVALRHFVAPLVGAWIEIQWVCQGRIYYQSLPSWERGLKSYVTKIRKCVGWSLPSWERGLKL